MIKITLYTNLTERMRIIIKHTQQLNEMIS